MCGESHPLSGASGFSLLELLLVLGVMAILLAAALPGLQATRRWLAGIESDSLFAELQTAFRLLHLEHGRWPASIRESEIAINEEDAPWRMELARYMESPLRGVRLRDGEGNSRIFAVLDLDGDRWIRPEDFVAMPRPERPEAIWARIVFYSMDESGQIAFWSW